MSSVRLEKITALIKKELSIVFRQNMNTMFKGVMITVTSARISPDLGVAKVYLSVFPPEKRNDTLKDIQKQQPHIRKLFGEAVGKQLRKVPELTFFIDDSLDYYEEIDKLLKK
jgi:ribosome-binding factor A